MHVLAIGNSFSQDGMTYLHQAAQAQGEWIVCESLVFPGCSLSQHFDFMKTERKAYEFFFNGEPVLHKISLKEALTDREWDVITVQQASGYAPKYETFQPYLNELVEYVRKFQPKAKIYVHQTWAYEDGSDLLKNKTVFKTQREMFENIKLSYEKAFESIGADGLIPSGQVFDNLASKGMKYHRDSMHASFGLGRYALALTWIKALTGKNIDDNGFRDFWEPVSEEDIVKIKKAVNEAF